MRKIREILRLSAAGLSARQIAGSVGVARSTVADCLRRAGQAGLGWPLPADLDEAELDSRLYPPPPVRDDVVPVPDWTRLHAELQRKGVDPAAVVAGVQGTGPRRLPVQPLLRPLPRLEPDPGSGAATDAHAWRQMLRRLRRSNG